VRDGQVFQTFLNISGHPTEETDNFHLQKCFIVNGFDTDFDIVSTQIDSIIEPVKYVETDNRYVAPTINPFMEGAFRKLNKIVYESLRHSCSSCKAGDAWIGPHSSLIMSGPGSGKSYLLREIITDISSKFISFRSVRDCSTDHPPFVFILSGDCAANFDSIKLSQDNTSMSLSRDDTTIHQFLLRILSLLVNFLPELRLGNEKRQPNFHESQLQKISDIVLKDGFLPPICVVIDNADDLLRSTDDSTSSSSAVEVGNSSKLASYYLRQLLAQLNTPACPHPVCVLAATSCTIRSDVAPYFLGPPGFESIVTLPLPSLTDRFLLFKTFLEDSCGSEELESVLGDLPLRFVSISHEENSLGELASDEQENSSMRNKLGCRSKFVFDWVMRASSLTAGYLPIDLKNIIKRAWNLNSNSDGTTIPPKSPTNDNFTDKKLLWSNFLAALTATTPAQLRSVAMSEGGSSGGIVVESRDSTLSWEDFAGYANEKKAISQILERSNPLYGKKMKMQESEARSNLIRAVGHHAPKGLILYGPSGCGKTHMARIIAAEVCA
jgi:SpoVK/Ycf46/Vps4 family AAA+-type ATPase